MSEIEQERGAGGGARGADAHSLRSAAPGPELAAVLAAVDASMNGADALEDFDLVEFVAAAQRLASWAHYLAATGAGALAERASMQPTIAARVSNTLTPERIAGEEVAMRLGWTSRAGQNLVHEGRQYRGQLITTGEDLRRGAIDPSKAKAIRQALEDVPWQASLGVQDMVLPKAPRRTPAQLANDVRSALVALDPAEAAERRERATAERYVSPPKPLPDGMAGLWLRTSAVDAYALYSAIDSAARSARKAGDPRTLEQLRADLLVERSLHDSGCTDPLTNRPRSPGGGRTGTTCRTAVSVDVRILVPLATVVGTEDEPGHLDGYGSIDPEHARTPSTAGRRQLATSRRSPRGAIR